MKEGCYKEGSKSKTYSVTIKSEEHSEQIAFQETEYFKEKSKERYKIEAKNSELKHGHGYDVATSSGLIGMELQGAMKIFAVNLKFLQWYGAELNQLRTLQIPSDRQLISMVRELVKFAPGSRVIIPSLA